MRTIQGDGRNVQRNCSLSEETQTSRKNKEVSRSRQSWVPAYTITAIWHAHIGTVHFQAQSPERKLSWAAAPLPHPHRLTPTQGCLPKPHAGTVEAASPNTLSGSWMARSSVSFPYSLPSVEILVALHSSFWDTARRLTFPWQGECANRKPGVRLGSHWSLPSLSLSFSLARLSDSKVLQVVLLPGPDWWCFFHSLGPSDGQVFPLE